ncbi:helix-turn-helix domain-containing protein [Sporomusa sp.]|uniref:winged helix-turn-helix transcriptional regulator n=1 Tax=Sporomusa sp. TaxID=2078658 RepID=UPI002B6A086B|nr:helix-turn-helix domain-containing protein [Sporomusa sp.]HWR45085.1 helix-turn-helix domain-containing protein [Sporomusa sp.]
MNNKMKPKEICACPVVYALNIIGGKWHLPIIWALSQNKVLRYSELKRNVCGITNMMLSQSLKELETNGLIVRVQYIEIPPRVEYALTEAGTNLLPALDELAKWGVKQMTTASKMSSCSKNEVLPEA